VRANAFQIDPSKSFALTIPYKQNAPLLDIQVRYNDVPISSRDEYDIWV